MRIISKFKDHYDYLVGKYGIDPIKVLDRTKGELFSYKPLTFSLFFCGESFLNTCKADKKNYYNIFNPNNLELVCEYIDDNGVERVWFKSKEKPKVIHDFPYYIYERTEFVIPNLKDIKFNMVYDSETTFLKIQEYISYKEPEISLKPEDMNRFESKGFSKKTSFRK